ncbi:mitochondrial aldehyde dehydrogenase succinate semialdehyde dehydrogenase [Scheffersomyces stipitis CBS 6054]|uniref:Mitochondrial aldehyde dehydrogenase succinate semialdehyde dehydrogenase n=1 Tax=Scheffersomyces stipitis (strain ATCC 58785 / CBS 6054 / NBRC 10063 / NRRL Y-11545) TaxID=322104 RepID=A3LSP9_PICST|nr:mitochondrial aldehyde dehydrogenase succinate semialdehyde dehydrogenase [Scheffersomyces stipitis CBS 6054]ABN65613.2 mitochondrial aldehyde dehydrogenase succinate semialdehyde dehydrogenase [Scheffersomyces stipitis CBS 6054]
MATASTTFSSIIEGKVFYTEGKHPVYSHDNHEEIIHHFSYLTDIKKSVPQIAAAAEQGFEEWSSFAYAEKVKIFDKAAILLTERRDELIASHKNIGGPTWFSHVNADESVSQLKEYTGLLSRPTGVVAQSIHTDLALTVRQPIGPVLAISPWNAPVVLASRAILAPLAAGCSVILKASEKAPESAYLIVRTFIDAGVPPKALQLVFIKPEDNATFISSILHTGSIRKINFTGSTLVGKKIAEVASKYLVPYLMELGGKNVSIVEKDADLTKAAGSIIWSSWSHKGQICMSTDKVFVEDSIYDHFIAQLKESAADIVKDPDYQISQRDITFKRKLVELVKDALDKGANLVFGELNSDVNSSSFSPLILENVTSDMLLDSTESFGPLFSVHKYANTNKLVKELNRVDYGLKASIWSHNVLEALETAKKIHVGGVHINSPTIHDEPTLPHGGVKSSGTGRFNSTWGIDDFSITKTITLSQ